MCCTWLSLFQERRHSQLPERHRRNSCDSAVYDCELHHHKTVDRIIDVFPETEQAQIRVMLSESLRGVIAQSLVRRNDGHGRVAAVEVLVNIPAVANLIREGKTFQIHSSMQTGQVHGMITFESAINELVRKGIVSRQDGQTFMTRRSVGRSSNGQRA